jgi:hypothetical protein
MKINYNGNSTFPDQVVPFEEKMSLKYGAQVAQAIQSEWFSQGRTNGNRYLTSFNDFHQRRLSLFHNHLVMVIRLSLLIYS